MVPPDSSSPPARCGSNTAAETVFRIDPATKRFTTIDTDVTGPAWLASTDDDVWRWSPDSGVVTIGYGDVWAPAFGGTSVRRLRAG